MITFSDLPTFTFLGDSQVTLRDMGIYVQNSSSSTWTLPRITTVVFYKTPKFYICKNMGTGIVTINSISGEFFSLNNVNTYTSINLLPGQGNIIFNDGTYWHVLDEINPAYSSFVGTVFTQTSGQTVSNVGETTLFGSGLGSLTLPANFWTVGKTLDVNLSGVYSTISTPGNLTIKVYLGSTVVANKTITNLLGSANNSFYDVNAKIACLTTGTSGSTVINGKVHYDSGSGTQSTVGLNNGLSNMSYDTTLSAQTLSIKATWATLNTGNTISSTTATVQALN